MQRWFRLYYDVEQQELYAGSLHNTRADAENDNSGISNLQPLVFLTVYPVDIVPEKLRSKTAHYFEVLREQLRSLGEENRKLKQALDR